MNIFVLDYDPTVAASLVCDKHAVKMPVETAQMMASALRRHGATDEQMPLTKSRKPYKGGYKHHPCTVWAGDNQANFRWLFHHGVALCTTYTQRYGRVHACLSPILDMGNRISMLPPAILTTEFPQAMPDELKQDCPVSAYRRYYRTEKRGIATWRLGNVPHWFNIIGESSETE